MVVTIETSRLKQEVHHGIAFNSLSPCSYPYCADAHAWQFQKFFIIPPNIRRPSRFDLPNSNLGGTAIYKSPMLGLNWKPSPILISMLSSLVFISALAVLVNADRRITLRVRGQ
jgi:hypothetical protein